MKINKLDVEVTDKAAGPAGATDVVASFKKMGKTGAAKVTKAPKGFKANGPIKNPGMHAAKKPATDSPSSQGDKAPKAKKAKM
jgi:hypothetical protein